MDFRNEYYNEPWTPPRVLVCGSRDWSNVAAVRCVLAKLPVGTVVIHGDCRGADKIAGSIATKLGLDVIAFPADWDVAGPAAGPMRNQRMIDEGKPTYVIAFHADIDSSKGTKDMIRRARAEKLPVEIVTGECPHDTNGDGDCHLCHRLPGGCFERPPTGR